MSLNTLDIMQWGDKTITTCLMFLLLELFLKGKNFAFKYIYFLLTRLYIKVHKQQHHNQTSNVILN